MAPESSYWPGWYRVRCTGCHGHGVTGVTAPAVCSKCGQSGFIFLHKESGMLAKYPGGPALGKIINTEYWIHERPNKSFAGQ